MYMFKTQVILNLKPVVYVATQLLLKSTALNTCWQACKNNNLKYRISSNSSRPSNRPRPRIDHPGCVNASEIQRALELSAQYN